MITVILWGAGYLAVSIATAAGYSAVRRAYIRRQIRHYRRRENQARRDVEAFRLRREHAAFAEIVAAEYGIPHQTRRTEGPR